jgi:hypothetical protein
MTGDKQKLLEYIDKTHKEFYTLGVNDIATPKSVNGVSEYVDEDSIYSSSNGSVPIHSRGSVLYNHYINELGLTKKYPLINDGDKIKYTYLKMPNIIDENVIAFSTVLPEEFELTNMVDYETQWEKMFMSPINMICGAIGMILNNNITLDNFF